MGYNCKELAFGLMKMCKNGFKALKSTTVAGNPIVIGLEAIQDDNTLHRQVTKHLVEQVYHSTTLQHFY